MSATFGRAHLFNPHLIHSLQKDGVYYMYMLQDYLPSKNFRVIIITIIGLCIIGYGISKIIGSGSGTIANKTVDLVVVNQEAQKDTDGDGALDWEENVWGTDPRKKNSNPDGISDADYIAKKREQFKGSNPNTANAIGAGNTDQTAAFAQQFLTTIMTLSQSGNLTDATIKNLTDEFFNNIKTLPEEANFYTIAKIKTVPTGGSAKLAYTKAIDTAFTKNQIKNDSTMLSIALALKYGDPSAVNGMEKIAKKYDAMEKALVAITVPEDAITMHLALINEYHSVAYNIRQSSKVLTDTLSAVAGILRYEEHLGKLSVALSNLKTYVLATN